MDILNFIIGAVFLVILSIVDLKTVNEKGKGIPSILTTTYLIIAFITNPLNLYVGLMSFLMAMLFTDLDMWLGIADFKVFVASSILFSLSGFFIFCLVLTIISLLFKAINVIYTKRKTMPLIPPVAISWLISVIIVSISDI